MNSRADTIDDIIGSELVERILMPCPEDATTLPNEAFTSERFLDAERRLLFARTWVFAGFASQIAGPGDARPVNPFGVPLILLRDESGELQCFQNVCRHRGVELLDAPCAGATRLTCPYHHWSYGLDGRNVARPHFRGPGGHEAEQQLSLYPVRCAQWWDLVFVNLDGKAPPFDEYIAPFADRLASYPLDSFKPAGVVPWSFAANWKLVQENYIESYHVFAVHPQLGDWTPSGTNRFGFDGACSYNEADFDEPDTGRTGELPLLSGLTKEQKQKRMYLHLFPNVDVGVWPNHLHVLVLWPEAPDRTREEIHIYTGEEALATEHDAAREAIFEGWRQFNGEDVDVVERLQKGRACPAYDGGTLSPYWDTVTHGFSQRVVRAMQ